MKENALVLNEADKTLMYLVGCDEGGTVGALPVSVHSVVSGGRRAENAVGESPSGLQERKNVPARRERTASDRSYCRRNEVDQADSRNRF